MRDSAILSLDMTIFRRNIPAPPQMGPVLGRSSYIDDIAHGASTWDQLCEDLDALLYRLRYWNISVSLPKSEFGKVTIPFLSHEVSADGIRALPKIVKGIENLPFPSTYRGVQSFLGSLNYYNKTKPFVIIPHANPWAACAVLGQEHEGLIHPVRFTGRVLNGVTLPHSREGSARNLVASGGFRPLIHGSEFPVVVYTRYSVLKWLLQSNTADGRHLKWGLELSRWTLEIHRTQKDEDGLAAILGSGITPRENLDDVAETLIPAKGRLKVTPPVSLEMLEADHQGYVLNLDGAAKVSTRRGSCGCILWKLSGRQVVKAEGHILEDRMKYDVKELVAVGDSRIVVQQAQGLLNCNQPNLQRRLAEYEDLRKNFVSVKLIHVKREFNQAADYLTSKTLVLGESWEVDGPDEIVHLRLVSRIPERS
ncbi:hypothetical protein PHMEG_00029298 [Phytophthora megakarya]|uniref:Reverse transcriptase n=1 Tax=Phytophthora megakarya TaxID=4795 RepID=A0A225V4L2_9STRA|nr:hypothetical protein PHMEG_00029298 [Phytophthora megakarya]